MPTIQTHTGTASILGNTASVDKEVLGAIFTILNADTALKTATGINPSTGASRPVAVHNQIAQNQPVPYVRITLTDSVLLDDEAFDYTQPTCESVFVLVNVFSTYQPETFNISSRLKFLLKHREITTAHYHGSTWLVSTDYFQDNQTQPDSVYQVAALRVRVNLEPLS